MKKISLFIVSILMLFGMSACSTFYPALPDATDGKQPFKGVEVYCWQTDGKWECGAILGTNRAKSDEEIRALQVVSLSQMRRILAEKNLTDCSYVVIVDLSGDEVAYLTGEEYDDERGWIGLYLGLSLIMKGELL